MTISLVIRTDAIACCNRQTEMCGPFLWMERLWRRGGSRVRRVSDGKAGCGEWQEPLEVLPNSPNGQQKDQYWLACRMPRSANARKPIKWSSMESTRGMAGEGQKGREADGGSRSLYSLTSHRAKAKDGWTPLGRLTSMTERFPRVGPTSGGVPDLVYTNFQRGPLGE